MGCFLLRQVWTAKHTPKSTINDWAQEQWVLGYLSGANVWMGSGGLHADVLAKPDHDALAAWMTNYCAQNPLDTIDAAASELMGVAASPLNS